MKRKFTLLFVIIILFQLCLIAFVSSIIPYTSNYGDLEYDFSNDNLYNIENPSFDDSYNIRNESEYSGNYFGTYSFENEVGLSNDSISWVDGQKYDGNVEVINEYHGHDSVLSFVMENIYSDIYNNFDNKLEGIIEFWINKNDTSTTRIYIEEVGVGPTLYFSFSSTHIYANNTIVREYSLNTWYHLKIEWFNNNTFDFWVNGIQEVDGWNSYVPFNIGINKFRFRDYSTGSFYDAIGYSWDSYNHYTFEDKPLYSYFDNSEYPYDSWDYSHTGSSYVVFNDLVPISTQYLRLEDGTGQVILKNNWNQEIIEGSISFNFRCEDTEDCMRFDLSDGSNSLPFNMWFGELEYSAYPENIASFNNNEWYKIQIDFNCITHLLDVYIDDFYIDSYQMYESMDNLIEIIFITSEGNWFDIDNLFYSFGYAIGDNMIPDKSYSNYYQTNKYQFTLDDVDTLIPIGDDNPLDWDDIESSGDVVNIVRQGWNGFIYIEATGNGEINGIEKTDFNINNTFIEFDIGFEFLSLTDPNGYSLLEFYSNDSTLILQFNITTSGLLQYYNGSDFIELRNDITINKDYRFNFVISYELSYCFLDFYIDDLFIESYEFSLIESTKIGLKSIIFESYTFSINQIYSLIDYIGIESNDYYPNEYSFLVIDLNESYNIKNHNLLTLELNGNISVLASENNYYPLQNNALLVDKVLFNESESYFTNTYDNYIESYDIGMLVFYLYSNFTLSYINIEGVLLTEGINEYFPIYYYGNIDLDVSYWFVSGNTLNYFLNCNDNNTEYIEILFNIDDITTYNYTFLFSSSNFNIFGREFRFNYNGGKTSIIDILYGNRFELVYLPSDKLLISIDILITDDDNYDDYFHSGSFSGFIARPYSEASLDITTSNFLEALIPLLFFMLLPSLLIVYSIDIKNYSNDITREKLFIPVLTIFCFIAYAFSQIELWMLFICIIGFATLFLSTRGDS